MEQKIKKPLIGIVGGKGKMGNWFKIFFEKQGLNVIISDKDTVLSNKEVAQKADIVIVSVPISETLAVIREIRNFVKKESLLTDITSIKTLPLREMSKAKSGVLGMHPLFGPLVPDLKNQTVVFCRKRDNQYVDFLKNLFQKNGAKIIEMSAKEHDRQMAFLQALLHFNNINFAYFLALKKLKMSPHLFTPIFKLQNLVLARILSQNPKLYAEIETENPYFKKILSEFIKEAQKFKKVIEEKNFAEFQKRFELAQKFFQDYLKVGESKSVEILKTLERQTISLGTVKKINIKKAKIGFLGPEGTFSWLAAKKIFPFAKELKPFSLINEIFAAVVKREVDLGVVPIENTIGGLVSETVYALIEHPVYVTASFKLQISHCLASWGKKLNEIKIIKTHPQAFSQCKKWLTSHLPQVLFEPTSSTVAPLFEDRSRHIGFILPFETAKSFKLNILARNIQDFPENFTRFFVISQRLIRPKNKKGKHTLLFLAVYDRVGVLRDILNVFADRKINLSALHSIPTPFASWDYLFFLEVDKFYFDPDFKEILKDLEKHCCYIRVVGIADKR